MIADQNVNTTKRDIALERQGSGLKRISELNSKYDPLQYPLIFPTAQSGYCINMPLKDPLTKENLEKTVSAMQYYAYRWMVRKNEFNAMLHSGALSHQFQTDMYAKVR